jgi:outer membrane protein TolC
MPADAVKRIPLHHHRPMVLSTESKYPSRRACVIKVRCDAKRDAEVAWRDAYGNPVLSDLVRRAARENCDAKIAAECVRAARAREVISRSWLFPSIK